ncbi:MAG: phage holin family protein [Candidatus Omnitrophica bacterium]|nr:phage holin family protein [Candidatus Omnitrophota bacterium]MBU0895206.1 phage holin family protein [Candidatus Omnitrophota bacterium]
MVSFFIKWLVNIIALFVVIHAIAGVSAANSNVVIVAALIIGLLNAFLRPVLIMLTLPFTIISLGFFTLIINAFMFYLASKFVAGFSVTGFWSAFWAALLFSVISFILNLVFAHDTGFKFNLSGNIVRPRKRYENVIDVEGTIVDQPNPSTGLEIDTKPGEAPRRNSGE